MTRNKRKNNKKHRNRRSAKAEPDSNSFLLVSWNICGLRKKFSANISKTSAISLETWFQVHTPAVTAFQETMLTEELTDTGPKNLNKYSIPGYQFYHHFSNVNKHRSLSICFSDSVNVIDKGEIGPDRLQAQFMSFKAPGVGKSILYNIYLPPEGASDTQLETTVTSLLSNLSDHITIMKQKGFRIFVMGDFNSWNPNYASCYPTKNLSNTRVATEENFLSDTQLTGHIFDSPTRTKGTQNGFLDRVFYSHSSSIDFIHLGQCLNGIGPSQYPDHRPLFTHLSGTLPIFRLMILHHINGTK